LADPDDQLTGLARDLDSALGAFAGGAGQYLPAGFDAAWGGTTVRGLRDESRHQAAWVASVGAAFRAAGDPDGDGIFSADNTFVANRVGEPTIAGAQAEARGRQAARDLQDLLRANGIDPSRFTPEQLRNFLINTGDDSKWRELYNQMRGVGENMWDPSYASGFYDEMGTEGIRTTLGVIDSFAYLRQSGGLIDDRDWMGSVQDNLLEPFVAGWALATRNPDTENERADLVNTRDPIQQRHLSLLMSGPPTSYDPQWLADGADRILVTGKDLNRSQAPIPGAMAPPDYPGLSHDGWLYDDKGLGVPQVVASRALDGNDAAGLNFLQRGPDRVHALVYPEHLPVIDSGNYREFEKLQNELESNGANVVQSGVTHPDQSVRESVMTNVMDVVVDEDAPLNEHVYGSLAAGVESNMPLIDRRINDGWTLTGQGYTHEGDAMDRTQDFLTELMGDDGARTRVRIATREYVQTRLDGLPVDPATGERPDDDLNQLGRVFGVVADADITSVTDEFERDGDRAALAGRVADYVVSWAPYGIGDANNVAVVANVSIGHWLEEGLSPDDAEFKLRLRNLLLDHRAVIEGQPLPSDDIAQMRRGADDARVYVIE
jgi:hypothetical protein